jgi:hypothetical protein
MSVDPNAQFNADYNQLVKDAAAYEEAMKSRDEADQEYTTGYQYLSGLIKSGANPETVLMMFIFLFCQQGFTEMDLGVHLNASIMTIQGDLNKCGSDIEQMGNTPTAKDKPPGFDIDSIAKSLSKILDLLNQGGSGLSPAGQSIQKALGSDTTGQLFNYMLKWRQDIFDDADPDAAKYNPNNNVREPAAGSGVTRTYHFDNKGDYLNPDGTVHTGSAGAGYLGSVSLLNQSLSQSGDPYQSTEAKKGWTDGANEYNSSVNAGSSFVQQLLQNLSKMIQAFQAFVNDIAHSLQTTSNSALQNIAKG